MQVRSPVTAGNTRRAMHTPAAASHTRRNATDLGATGGEVRSVRRERRERAGEGGDEARGSALTLGRVSACLTRLLEHSSHMHLCCVCECVCVCRSPTPVRGCFMRRWRSGFSAAPRTRSPWRNSSSQHSGGYLTWGEGAAVTPHTHVAEKDTGILLCGVWVACVVCRSAMNSAVAVSDSLVKNKVATITVGHTHTAHAHAQRHMDHSIQGVWD